MDKCQLLAVFLFELEEGLDSGALGLDREDDFIFRVAAHEGRRSCTAHSSSIVKARHGDKKVPIGHCGHHSETIEAEV